MKTITGPWVYRTPLATIEYGAGPHEVTEAIATAFDAEHPKEEANDGTAKAGSPRGTRPA